MEATRVRARLAPTGEWLVATLFLLATIGVSTLILQELRTPVVRPATAAGVEASEPADVPAAIPAQAVSVSSLLLMNGVIIRVGDTEARIADELPAATLEASAEDRGTIGRRAGVIASPGDLGPVKIGHDMVGGSAAFAGAIGSAERVTSVTIGGSLYAGMTPGGSAELEMRVELLSDAGQFGGIGRLVHAPSLARPPVSVMAGARR